MNKLLIQRLSLVASDLISMLLAFLFSIWLSQLYHHDLWSSPWSNFFHFGVSKLLGLVVIATFWYHEQYSKRRPFWEELLQTYRLIMFFTIINLGLAFVLEKNSLKVMLVSFWLVFAIMLPLLRSLVKSLLLKINFWQRDLYVLGHGRTAQEAYRLFAKNRLMGYRLIAFVDCGESSSATPLPGELISELHLISNIKANPLCDVVVGLDSNFLKDKVRLINFLQHNCLTVLVLPEIAGLALYGAQIEHFFGNDQLVLRLNNNLARKSNIIVKRIFDLVCVSFGIILLLPVFIVLAILVRFSGTKKIFYLHKRVGRHGEPFYCIKFQTMYSNSAELLSQLLVADPQIKAEWEQSFKLKNDPRVTPLGRWLRKTSLDELPQLFNVLIGEMSLVGPRPIINEEIARYQDGYYYYQLVLPGVSGLWQVSGRSEVDYSDRVRLDEWYVKNWSLWYDIVILIKTIGVVVKRSGAY